MKMIAVKRREIMKKLVALLLALVMILCLTACGKKNKEPKDNGSEPVAVQGGEVGIEETEKPVSDSGNITMDNLMKAPESPEADFYCVEYGNGDIVLEDYLGSDEIVVIPESLGVTHIGAYVFANDSCVKAVRLSNSTVIIENYAFALNENLELVVCGNGLRELGVSAFQNCQTLREIVLNDGLERVLEFSLSGSNYLMSVDIPATVTEIHYDAFYSLPEGFYIIGDAGSYAEEFATTEGYTFRAK